MEHDKNIENQEKDLFSKTEVSYSKSKEDIWAEMESKLEVPTPVKGKIVRFRWVKLAAAASVLLIIGLGGFAKLYTVTISIPAGETASHVLPDGSTVYLNAKSSIDYHPYWWNFSRSLNLNGEAFFEVKKGSKFSVDSDLGTVAVLGTSFNIYSRGNDYNVYCATGTVSVSDNKKSGVVLLPGEATILQPSELITLEKVTTDKDAVMAWRNDKFIYNDTPLNKVLEDLERHYNVVISTTAEGHNYTGRFDRSITLEEALEIICFSFEFEFEKGTQNTYIIKQ
jgi:ferric-dicitrate binding protein FerR (iron transport regulator)